MMSKMFVNVKKCTHNCIYHLSIELSHESRTCDWNRIMSRFLSLRHGLDLGLFFRLFFRNTTQTAVINIFKIRILLNLTFCMFVHIHFQKYNRYGFWEAIYTTKIGLWNLEIDDLQ